MLNGQIISDKELSGSLIKNEELFNHDYLYNRNAADAHPIQAITGLKEKLTELENQAPMEFKSIKAEISRLLTSIANESTRARASEKQIQTEIATITEALIDIQNNEELEKITLDVIKLKTENLALKNELAEALNKISEGLVEQVGLIQNLSENTNRQITGLTKTDIELKEAFSEKFRNIEAFISENAASVVQIEKQVASQEAALVELGAKLEALDNNSEVPGTDFLDSLMKTFVTTEDFNTIKDDFSTRIAAIENDINGAEGILARLGLLETQATAVHNIAKDVQSLSREISDSKAKTDINGVDIKANKEKLQEVQLAVENNTTNISAVKAEMDNVLTAIETLDKGINENKAEIAELFDIQVQLEDLKNKTVELRAELLVKIQSEVSILDATLDKITAYINNFDLSVLPDIQKNLQALAIDLSDIKISTEKANNLTAQTASDLEILQKELMGDLNSLRFYVDNKYQDARQEMLSKNSGQQVAIDGIKLTLKELLKSDEFFSTSIDNLNSVTKKQLSDLHALETIIGDSSTQGSLSYQAEKNSVDISVNKGNIAQLATKVTDLSEKDKELTDYISSVYNRTLKQDKSLETLNKKLTALQIDIFGTDGDSSNEGLNADIKDLQNQLNNMSSVFRFVGIIDTTTTKTTASGKPDHLVLNSSAPINKVTLKDSIFDSNNPYEAHSGDVVLVERFDEYFDEETGHQKKVSLGYAEFIYLSFDNYKDWEEIGNIQTLDVQLQHHIQSTINDNNNFKANIDKQVDELRQDITHHIANDFVTRSLIFTSKEAAEMYALGMDPDRFPTPGGGGNPEYAPTNAYPGLIITVATDGLYESYIIKEDRSLTLISGAGGGGGSPDRETDYQYCFRASAALDTSFAVTDNGGFVDGYVAVGIERPTRKNNTLLIDASSVAGGEYIYYLSTLSNLKFTCNGFEATFINLGQLEQVLNNTHYILYRSNRKITEAIELVVN